ARADHFVDEDQVVANRACDRGWWDVVAARPYESRQPFFAERLRPGQESRHRLRRRVYAEASDDGRNSGDGKLPQKNFRGLRAEAAPPAPAQQRLGGVNQPGRDKTTARVNDVQIEPRSLNGAPVTTADLLDPFASQEHGLDPAGFGRINETV